MSAAQILALISVVIRGSEWLFKTKWAIFQLYIIYKFWSDADVHFVLDQHLSFIQTEVCGVEMLFLSDTLSWYWTNQSLFLLVNAVRLVEKQQIPNSKVYGLSLLGHVHTIYGTWSKHTNHYTTNYRIPVVLLTMANRCNIKFWPHRKMILWVRCTQNNHM